MPSATGIGADGIHRCPWAISAPGYQLYHDKEWGRPVGDGFRRAFAGFDPAAAAAFTDDDVARLLGDPGIVRHRGKILATIGNARATCGCGSFVGPTTVYAAMQSLGVVNDHLEGCHFRAACDDERRAFTRPR